MAKFTSSHPNIKSEFSKDASLDKRVVKIDVPVEPNVQTFEAPRLQRPGEGTYASTKAKYGALAATDPDRAARSRKDARFTLNPLLRDPLAVEEEERRAIDERVRLRIAEVQDQAREQALAEGFAVGKQEGYDHAFQEFRQEGAQRIAELEGLLSTMEQAKAEILRANERFVMETAFQIARMILLKELSTDPDYVLRIARELVDRVGIRDNVKIAVSARDLENIEMLKSGLTAAFGTMKNLSIESSDQVEQGGLMIETEWNAIDARIETQLARAHAALLEQPSNSDSGAASNG